MGSGSARAAPVAAIVAASKANKVFERSMLFSSPGSDRAKCQLDCGKDRRPWQADLVPLAECPKPSSSRTLRFPKGGLASLAESARVIRPRWFAPPRRAGAASGRLVLLILTHPIGEH